MAAYSLSHTTRAGDCVQRCILQIHHSPKSSDLFDIKIVSFIVQYNEAKNKTCVGQIHQYIDITALVKSHYQIFINFVYINVRTKHILVHAYYSHQQHIQKNA